MPGVPSIGDWAEVTAMACASARKPPTPAPNVRAEIAVLANRRREKCLSVIRVSL